MSPSLDIVIVNWNSGDQLRACLSSIASTRPSGLDLQRVVVVDNGSRDGSARQLPSSGIPLVVMENAENRGFAAACNQGASGSRADHLLFLNPDTVLLPGSLGDPVAYLERPEAADVGICGIQLLEDDGSVARSCSRFPTTTMFLAKMLGLERVLPPALARQPMTDWDHSTDRDVDQVIGAFFLVRRRLFEELGGFDERFFVYFEEVDLSRRAADRGFRSRYLAGTRAYHKGGGCSDQVRARRLEYSIRSRLAYARKHFSPVARTVTWAATLTVEPATRLVMAALRGPAGSTRETLAAYRPIWFPPRTGETPR